MNKTIDNGYIKLISSSNDSKILKDIVNHKLGQKLDERLYDMSHATFEIKSPIFVRMIITQFLSTNISLCLHDDSWVPDITYIESGKNKYDIKISDHIKRITEYIKTSIAGYKSDGCNNSVANSITTVNMYNTFIVTGSLRQFKTMCNMKNIPLPAEKYIKAIEDMVSAIWVGFM